MRDKTSGRLKHGGLALSGLVLLALWLPLIDGLRVEWSVNPQYGYGWAVPFLCCYLGWLRLARPAGAPASALPGPPSGLGPGKTAAWPSRRALVLFALLALAYAPTRLIQEANPEWRLVSWALALEVAGLTLVLLRGASFGPRLAFPILFFLVAIPWPTMIEGPLIQTLTKANTAASVEALGWLGIPALQHGNTIEVSSGLVGIDEACSGIRSFQASLMISLFLGGLFALGARRVAACALAGFALAMVFNLARTTLLTAVAARQGLAAMTRWHDPAGAAILVACFASIGWLARALARPGAGQPAMPRGGGPPGKSSELPPDRTAQGQRLPGTPAALLLGWLIVVEAGVELWYRAREMRLPAPITWRFEMPRANPAFQELPFSGKARQLLRYDEGANASWEGADGTRWQAIFLRWDPGRVAVHLARSHTPEICLAAAGREVSSQADPVWVAVQDLQLPFRSYVMADAHGPVHIFYCLWEDRAESQSASATRLTYANRLAPVFAGRRNQGQRSLEVAIRGCADGGQAEAALAACLQKQIKR